MQTGKIATAAECRQWASEMLSASGSSALDDPNLLLSQLVKLGRLTPYQANVILSNDLDKLTIGKHKLLAPLNSPALRDWFEAIDPSSNAVRWLYAISAERLKSPELANHPPSLKLARLHARIDNESLQSFSPPAFVDDYLFIVTKPVVGRSLREIVREPEQKKLPADVVGKLIRCVATGLAKLHEAGLVHGAVGLDQIWWDGAEEVCLLRDPFFPPSSPLVATLPAAIGVPGDQDNRIRYAAPEFSAPGQQPNPATDIYALGCVWWELLNGQAPYAETTLDKVPTAVAKFPLAIPQVKGLSSGHSKCLSYTLAKNPSSRFKSATELLLALDALNSRIETATQTEHTVAPEQQLKSKIRDEARSISTEMETAKFIDSPARPELAHATLGKQTTHPRNADQPKPQSGETNQVETAIPLSIGLVSNLNPTTSEPKAKALTDDRSGNPRTAPTQLKPPVTPEASSAAKKNPPANTIIKIAEKPKASKAKLKAGKKKAKRPVWLLPGMLGACVVLLGGLIWLLSPPSEQRVANTSNVSSTPNEVEPSSNASDPTEQPISNSPIVERTIDPMLDQFAIVSIDDGSPWLPPRPGKPFSLGLIPPGAQGFLFVRPSSWLENDAGLTLVEGLGPEIESLWQPLAKIGKWKATDFREIAVAMYGGRTDGWPRLAYRMSLVQPMRPAELLERFAQATEQPVGERERIFTMGEEAVYFDTKGGIDAMIDSWSFGPAPLMNELAEMEGQAGPLRRQMEQLWLSSDSESDFTAIFSTPPFFSDARSVLPSISPRAVMLGQTWLDNKAQAVLVTTTLQPKWYGEIRITGNTNDESIQFVKQLKESMKPLADSIESELNANPAAAYWRSLASRFPQMLRTLAKFQRFGFENGQAVTNFYLPTNAASNLLVASWMTLQAPSTTPVESTQSPAGTTPAAKSVIGEAALDYPVDIAFDQEPLDLALKTIMDEVNNALPPGSSKMTLDIDGKAFELAGVTRNQQIREFRFKQQPLRKLLNDIAGRLNPDRTVKGLTEDKQVVVWLVDVKESEISIQFSTRSAAKAANRSLTPDFAAPQ
jgi:serine/threonine protein kinase